MKMRAFILASIVVAVTFCNAQEEIVLRKDQLADLAKLGTVRMSGTSSVELAIPEFCMDSKVEGPCFSSMGVF
jgi:hypothetical protein